MVIDDEKIKEAFEAVNTAIAVDFKDSGRLSVAAIANGGIAVGKQLASMLSESLAREVPCGVLNISFERDDFGNNPIPKDAKSTSVPYEVDDADIILVDDVIFSGRTVRAALNELFSLGRPKSVSLAVLADRGHRRLPVQPDYVGMILDTKLSQNVQVEIGVDGQGVNNIKVLD